MGYLILPVDPGDDSVYAETMRAESREPRAESREPRAESREPRAESREPRAESREPRAESREPRAESRELCPRRGSPPSTSPPSRANLLRSDTDLSAAAAPAASACPGPGARGAGRAVSGLSADRRGAPPESSPPAPGGLAPDRAAATGAGHAGAFARLRPALFRAAACLVVAIAALLALPGGASAQDNSVRPSWSLTPSGLSDGDQFRLIFLTSTGRSAQRHVVEHRGLQHLRAGPRGGGAHEHPALQLAVPGGGVDGRGRCPRQHEHHRDRGADLLAERRQGRRQLRGLLRRQLEQRGEREDGVGKQHQHWLLTQVPHGKQRQRN